MEKIIKTDAEWRLKLSELAYKVTRKHGTERPFSNDNFPNVNGIFSCVCCKNALFDSNSKFDSGTGWPSFFEPINANSIEEKPDQSLFMRRTEVLCSRCDAHLGHVFPDGPLPSGLRYCMNGIAMVFEETK
jgi:peptide-methionine (R)-S-oxide reductase